MLPAFATDLSYLKLPPGFTIEIYASVPDAREMALGNNNIVFVGSRIEGKVYAVVPDEKNPQQPKVLTIADRLIIPNGVAFHHGDLYVADLNRILRFTNIEKHLMHPPKPTIITDKLPKEKHHGWRYIKFGPDGKLYVAIGAPCNICVRKDPRFATIMRMNADGSHQEIFARGVRNSVGFTWNPITKILWFTDNGRDWLGDDEPPDELNFANQSHLHFGFPYCYGNNVSDPYFHKTVSCAKFTPAFMDLPAHVAALGMLFYRGEMFPKTYQQQVFIAEHGSWNRTTKVGYQVVSVKFNANDTATITPFVTGWLNHEGRPVDVLEMPDGALLISDDNANRIYRVSYKQQLSKPQAHIPI